MRFKKSELSDIIKEEMQNLKESDSQLHELFGLDFGVRTPERRGRRESPWADMPPDEKRADKKFVPKPGQFSKASLDAALDVPEPGIKPPPVSKERAKELEKAKGVGKESARKLEIKKKFTDSVKKVQDALQSSLGEELTSSHLQKTMVSLGDGVRELYALRKFVGPKK